VAHLLGVPRAALYRWQSLSSPGAPRGPRAFRLGWYLRCTLDDVQSDIQRYAHVVAPIRLDVARQVRGLLWEVRDEDD